MIYTYKMAIYSILCFFISTVILVVTKLCDKDPPPVFGVYQRRNGLYWIKVLIVYIIFKIRKLQQKISGRKEDFYKQLDKVQNLHATPLAVDAVYFTGSNKQGDFLTLGTARRINRLIDGFLYVKITSSEYGLLEFPKLPDTSLFNTGEEESYEAEGIKVIPVEPMKKWRITFSGKLREAANTSKLHDVTIDAIYTSDEPWFSYDTQMDAWDMAKVLAYEKWSRSYFNNVKKAHQLHYEQFGIIEAKVVVDSQEFHITVDSARDHTYASHRDWASFRRYAIHWVTTENGDHFSFGCLCQPVSYSRMKFGYMYNARDRKMYPITNCDFELYQMGELGSPPKDYAFTFKAGKTEYAMQVNISEAPFFYISRQWECKVFECLCEIEVNGIKGYGGAEWCYRNVEGRNVAKNN